MANSILVPRIGFANGYGQRAIANLRDGRLWIAAGLPVFWRVYITYSDISTAATTNAYDLNTHNGTGKEFPENVYIRNVYAYLHTTFDGGATSELTVEIGDTGDPNGAVTSLSVHEDATGATGWQTLSYGTELADKAMAESAYVPEILFTSTGADIDALTQGAISVIYELVGFEVPPTE